MIDMRKVINQPVPMEFSKDEMVILQKYLLCQVNFSPDELLDKFPMVRIQFLNTFQSIENQVSNSKIFHQYSPKQKAKITFTVADAFFLYVNLKETNDLYLQMVFTKLDKALVKHDHIIDLEKEKKEPHEFRFKLLS